MWSKTAYTRSPSESVPPLEVAFAVAAHADACCARGYGMPRPSGDRRDIPSKTLQATRSRFALLGGGNHTILRQAHESEANSPRRTQGPRRVSVLPPWPKDVRNAINPVERREHSAQGSIKRARRGRFVPPPQDEGAKSAPRPRSRRSTGMSRCAQRRPAHNWVLVRSATG